MALFPLLFSFLYYWDSFLFFFLSFCSLLGYWNGLIIWLQAVLNLQVPLEYSKEVSDCKHLIKTLVMGRWLSSPLHLFLVNTVISFLTDKVDTVLPKTIAVPIINNSYWHEYSNGNLVPHINSDWIFLKEWRLSSGVLLMRTFLDHRLKLFPFSPNYVDYNCNCLFF